MGSFRKLFGAFQRLDGFVVAFGNRWQAYLAAGGAFGVAVAGGAYLVSRLALPQELGWGWPEFVLAGILLACVVSLAASLLFFALGYRHRASNASGGGVPAVEPEAQHGGEYKGDHELLMLFVVDHLLPTLGAQWMMQYAIIKAVVPPVFCDLAVAGLQKQGTDEFQSAWERLESISGSPPEFVPFREMIDAVWAIERGYIAYCAKGAQLVANSGKDVWGQPELSSPASEWISQHESMIAAYEPIRRNSRLGKLFRPRRPSRFGQPVLEGTLFIPPGD